jgi:hypothetical protein
MHQVTADDASQHRAAQLGQDYVVIAFGCGA